MEEQKINALVNIGQSKLVEKGYDDIFSPPSKKVGSALSTIIDISNTILWPIKWVNERTRIYFENNIKKYEERISKIPDEKIVEVPTEISMPIIERFSYVSNEQLSNAFVSLLTSASSSDTIEFAHPGFIAVIDRLSPDEAKILIYFRSNEAIAKLDIKLRNPENATYKYIVQNETGLTGELGLKFPQNIRLYLDNLVSLGIVQITDYFQTDLEEKFSAIEANFVGSYNSYKKEGETDEQHQKRKQVDKGMYLLTDYGRLFIRACITNG